MCLIHRCLIQLSMFSELINIGARSCYFVFSCCGRSNVFSNKNCLVMKNIATTVVAKPPTLSTKDPEGWTPLHEVTEMNFVFLSLKPLGGCIVSYCLGHLLDAMQIMTHIYIYIYTYIYIYCYHGLFSASPSEKNKKISRLQWLGRPNGSHWHLRCAPGGQLGRPRSALSESWSAARSLRVFCRRKFGNQKSNTSNPQSWKTGTQAPGTWIKELVQWKTGIQDVFGVVIVILMLISN